MCIMYVSCMYDRASIFANNHQPGIRTRLNISIFTSRLQDTIMAISKISIAKCSGRKE